MNLHNNTPFDFLLSQNKVNQFKTQKRSRITQSNLSANQQNRVYNLVYSTRIGKGEQKP